MEKGTMSSTLHMIRDGCASAGNLNSAARGEDDDEDFEEANHLGQSSDMTAGGGMAFYMARRDAPEDTVQGDASSIKMPANNQFRFVNAHFHLYRPYHVIDSRCFQIFCMS